MDETILTAQELERVHHNRNQSFNIPSFGEKKSEPTQEDQTPLSNEEKRWEKQSTFKNDLEYYLIY